MIGTDLHQIPDVDKEKFDEYLIVGHVPCNRLNVDMSNKFYRTDYYMCIDAGAGYKEHGGNLYRLGSIMLNIIIFEGR